MDAVWVLSVVEDSDLLEQMVASSSATVLDMAIRWYRSRIGIAGLLDEEPAERNNVAEKIEKYFKGSSVYLRHHLVEGT